MKYIPDFLLISGTATLCYGSWLVYQPAGFIVGGILVIYAGLKLSVAK
jgi:hypothetical protein